MIARNDIENGGLRNGDGSAGKQTINARVTTVRRKTNMNTGGVAPQPIKADVSFRKHLPTPPQIPSQFQSAIATDARKRKTNE
jgi:hypothetical protein